MLPVPDRVEIGRPACQHHRNEVAAPIAGAAHVQRLVQIDDEVHDEAQSLAPAPVTQGRIGQLLLEALKGSEHVVGALASSPGDRAAIAHVQEVPGLRVLPLGQLANPVWPQACFRERHAREQRLEGNPGFSAEVLLSKVPGHPVTGRAEGVD